MARRTPPKGFESGKLELASIKTGTRFFRLYSSRYPDPLGFGFAPSRFSDPRAALPEKDRFGIIYFGSSLKVCFLERVLRDLRNGQLASPAIKHARNGKACCCGGAAGHFCEGWRRAANEERTSGVFAPLAVLLA